MSESDFTESEFTGERAGPMAFRELTPVTFLERAAAVFGGRPAVRSGDLTYTYAEFWDRAQRLAGALAARGVRPGDRVAVLSPNTHILLEAHYGVPLAGAVLVALNTRLAASEIRYILEHSGASVLIVEQSLTTLADTALTASAATTPAEPAATALAEPARLTIDRVDGTGYEAMLAAAEPHHVPVTDERSLLSINYTSGTTGRPKGVMYHHRGAYLQAMAMAYHAGLTPDSTYLWTLPMFHTNGWCFPWAVTAAGAVHRCLSKPDPAQIWHAIQQEDVTHFCAAPTVLAMLAEHPMAEGKAPRPVKVFAGGAPPWPTLLRRMTGLGIDIQHLYGLTETFGPAVVSIWQPEWDALPEEERAALMARQGVANVVAEPLRVVAADGRDVPADGASMGEILLRGNDVMLGYYRDEEATRAAAHDDWFRTGDVGVLHPDGYVEIRDRIKDVIISGGENIASVEVEAALTAHPDVLEAAVVGVSHPKWQEVPVAYVTLRAAADVTEAELIAFVRERLARFKAPRRVVLGELPKTSTGKIQKNVLRERAAPLADDLEDT